MPTTIALRPSGTAHILLDERGRGWIDDTNVKVIEIVLDTMGTEPMTPEEIHAEWPHISMAQIYAALSWYHDHKAEYDAEIERQLREFDAAREAQQKTSPIVKKLKEMGLIG
jgi:uncharacterized protein (DUF433 family)